jgi:putative NADH-flavin reductase
VMKVCIVGASGKLGQYMVQHALDRGYQVVGVCREQSVAKLDGGGPGERRTDTRSTSDRRLPDTLGARACR